MMPAEYDVTGKVVFITGAGRGIGKGIAQVLAEAGADIALNALTPKYVEPDGGADRGSIRPARRAGHRRCHQDGRSAPRDGYGALARSGASTCW